MSMIEYTKTEKIFVEELSRIQDYVMGNSKDDIDMSVVYYWLEDVMKKIDNIKIRDEKEKWNEVNRHCMI